MSATVDGAINGLDTTIVGIYTTGVRELDERSLVVRLDTAQTLLATSRVSRIVVVLHRTEDTAAVGAALTNVLGAEKRPRGFARGRTSRPSTTRSAACSAGSSASSASSSPCSSCSARAMQ